MALAVVNLGTSPESAESWQFGHFQESLGSQEKERFSSASWPNTNFSSFCSKI
jgi:hypothetical protein